MADLLFVLLTVGFFALAALLVRGCDRLVGPDADDLEAAAPPLPTSQGTPAGSVRS